jgi:hypothetical protein
MSDDLLVITQFEESWEAARTLLWKSVNERLHARGTRARLSTSRLPPGLTLDAALSRLKADVANLTRVLNQHHVDVSAHTPWLVLGRLPIPLNKSSIEYELKQQFNSLAAAHVDAGFWEREIVDPMKKHADKIRDWVKELKKRAGRPEATSASCKKIPPQKRTRPMSLKEAARLMGYKAVHSKKAAENLRSAMDAGAVAFEALTRKSFVFSRDDFPKESWPKILPKP